MDVKGVHFMDKTVLLLLDLFLLYTFTICPPC